MKFTKPPLSVEQQVDLLLARGMQGDRAEMLQRLTSVSYYRLSGYWFHRKLADNTFQPGTHFQVVWDQYVFDRKLRIVFMVAIERIEVGLRTFLSYHHARAHGPFGYADDPASLPKLDLSRRADLLKRITDEVVRNQKRELFVKHFFETYGDRHTLSPIWVVTEVMSFGCVLSLWQATTNKVKNEVARMFKVSDEVLRSWLWSLNEVRNICAHHGRLWNRDLGNKPTIPHAKHHPHWHAPVAILNHRVFGVLTVCAHSLALLAPNSHWQRRLRDLLNQHPKVPIKNMGFPENWLDCPIWKGAADAA